MARRRRGGRRSNSPESNPVLKVNLEPGQRGGSEDNLDQVSAGEAIDRLKDSLVKQGGFTIDIGRSPMTVLMELDRAIAVTDKPNRTQRKLGYDGGASLLSADTADSVRVEFVRSQDDRGERRYAADLSDAPDGMADEVLRYLQQIDDFERKHGEIPPEYEAARLKLAPIAEKILAGQKSEVERQEEVAHEVAADPKPDGRTGKYDHQALKGQESATPRELLDAIVRRYGSEEAALREMGEHERRQYFELKAVLDTEEDGGRQAAAK